jgi:hypothetical protein
MLCGSLRDRIHPWLRDYVKLQSLAVFLIYAQVFSLSFSVIDSNLLGSSRVHRFSEFVSSLWQTRFSELDFFPVISDWVRANRITRSIIQWSFVDKFGDCFVRACCYRE